jgi:hypothetical protein
MTTLNARSHRLLSRRVGLVGSSLVVVLLTVGCSSPAPESSMAASTAATATAAPTAVSDVVEAPQSEAEAIEAATAVVQSYLDIRATIESEHPADSSAIDSIAIGNAASDMHSIAEEISAQGTIISGSYAIDITSAYATDLTLAGTVYPFGNARLEGCFSNEAMSATAADGTPTQMIADRRGVVQASVFYIAAESRWFLTELGIAGTEVVPC